MENVILVDEFDNEIGSMEKMEAHRKGMLHRAFSVFLFNTEGKLLIQQRALTKYHSPGLWTNTCCSHPRPNEPMENAVKRRLHEELGLDCRSQFVFKFQYRAVIDNQLIEHEMDHVYVGTSIEEPIMNREEVHSWKFARLQDLHDELTTRPESFTTWFKMILAHKEFKSFVGTLQDS